MAAVPREHTTVAYMQCHFDVSDKLLAVAAALSKVLRLATVRGNKKITVKRHS
jgi:hypothetical protein